MSDQNTTPTGIELVISHILSQHPGSMPFGTAAAYLNQKLAAAHTARVRGAFPVRTRYKGAHLIVFTSDLIDYLRTGQSQSALSDPPRKKHFKIRTGRPTKRESSEAKARGLTVKELRAQSSLELGGDEGRSA